MTGKSGGAGQVQVVAVDFALDSAVVAVQDRSGTSFPALPGSHILPGSKIPRVQSLVHFAGDGSVLVGEEVRARGLGGHPSTVQRMQHYIATQNPARFCTAEGRSAGYPEAGAVFLSALLEAACNGRNRPDSLVFVFPPGAGQPYLDWIRTIRPASSGLHPVRLIDAVTATVLGYGVRDTPGILYLLIDAGECSVTATAAMTGTHEDVSEGSLLRVLGTASDETGSARVDSWIVEDVVTRCRLRPGDPRVKQFREQLAREAARVRGELAAFSEVIFSVTDPASGFTVTSPFSGEDLGRVLLARDLYTTVERIAGRALAAAQGRGADLRDLSAVLLTGVCWALPGLVDAVRERFGADRVHADHPLDARVLGALAAVPSPLQDRIKNDYAVRYWDPASREHRYRFLVRAGARYPSAGQAGRFVISAAYDGQTHLGVPLFRFSRQGSDARPEIELVSDEAGGMRVSGPAPDAMAGEKSLWVNERAPTLLVASPPAVKGEPRFELTFTIDAARQLCLTARDLVTGELIRRDMPVYRLD